MMSVSIKGGEAVRDMQLELFQKENILARIIRLENKDRQRDLEAERVNKRLDKLESLINTKKGELKIV